MEWKSVLHDLHVQLYFVRVIGDDIQLSEPLVVDERRRANLRAILNIPVAVDDSDRLPIPRITEQFNRVGGDSFIGVGVARRSSRVNRLAKVSEARLYMYIYIHTYIHHPQLLNRLVACLLVLTGVCACASLCSHL